MTLVDCLRWSISDLTASGGKLELSCSVCGEGYRGFRFRFSTAQLVIHFQLFCDTVNPYDRSTTTPASHPAATVSAQVSFIHVGRATGASNQGGIRRTEPRRQTLDFTNNSSFRACNSLCSLERCGSGTLRGSGSDHLGLATSLKVHLRS